MKTVCTYYSRKVGFTDSGRTVDLGGGHTVTCSINKPVRKPVPWEAVDSRYQRRDEYILPCAPFLAFRAGPREGPSAGYPGGHEYRRHTHHRAGV